MSDAMQIPPETTALTVAAAPWWRSLRQRILRDFREDRPPEPAPPDSSHAQPSGKIRLTAAAAAAALLALGALGLLFRLIPGSLTVNATSSLLQKEAQAAGNNSLHDVAARRYEEALTIGFRQASQTRSVRLQYVQALVSAGQKDKALEVLAPLAETGQAGLFELLIGAELLLDADRPEDALKWARETASRAEKENKPVARAAAQAVEGGALMALGNLPEARQTLQASLKVRPSGDAAVYLARIELRDGKPAEARALLQRYLLAGGGRLTAEARALHREITTRKEADQK